MVNVTSYICYVDTRSVSGLVYAIFQFYRDSLTSFIRGIILIKFVYF